VVRADSNGVPNGQGGRLGEATLPSMLDRYISFLLSPLPLLHSSFLLLTFLDSPRDIDNNDPILSLEQQYASQDRCPLIM
jgi:hypothetical protein